MDAIDKAWAEYKEVDAKVIEVGATTDTAKSLQAQQMMTDEAAPKYQALDDALQKLMALNISLGNAKRAQLRTVMIAALTIIIIVIAVSTIYSNSLSVAISKSIEKPLNELKDRFITFAEGDIDSPLPTVESEDEIKELVSGVSAMSDRIRVIIKDSGRMLNEMSEGNFAIDTECEEVYTGAFTDLLTGIRKMNEEIDTTVRGVDDASGQVLTGSTNLAEAAQSLAEGATDQAASVEEMQATINELTSGIKTTAEELGTAYDEAYKYAEIAEGSRGDMEVLVHTPDQATQEKGKTQKGKEVSIAAAVAYMNLKHGVYASVVGNNLNVGSLKVEASNHSNYKIKAVGNSESNGKSASLGIGLILSENRTQANLGGILTSNGNIDINSIYMQNYDPNYINDLAIEVYTTAKAKSDKGTKQSNAITVSGAGVYLESNDQTTAKIDSNATIKASNISINALEKSTYKKNSETNVVTIY